MILDASSDGVLVRDIQYLSDLDKGSLLQSIIVFRPLVSEDTIALFIEDAKSHIGKPYDFYFDMNDEESLYCSELIVNALSVAGIHVSYTSEKFWRVIVSPEDILNYILEE